MQKFKNIYLPIIILIVGVFIFISVSLANFLKDPSIWPDEAIFFDIYTNLARTGNMATSLFKDLTSGLQIKALWYPPLYFYLLSFWTSIFGQSIEAARSFSFLVGLGSLGIFFCILKMLFKNWWYVCFGLIFLMFDSNFGSASKIARMEILVFFFLLLAILCYLKARKFGRPIYYILTGVFLGLGLLTHTIGLVSLLVIFLFLIMEKGQIREKITQLIYIMIPICIGTLFWFLSVFNNLSLFLTQYSLQVKQHASAKVVLFIVNLTNDVGFRMLYVSYAVIIMLLIYLNFKYRNWLSWFCLLGFLVFTSVPIIGNVPWYFLFFQPFLTLSILALFKIAKTHSRGLLIKFLILLSLIIFLLNLSFILEEIRVVKDANYFKFAEEISNKIPSGSTVFLSVIPDPYFNLVKRKDIKIVEFPTLPISNESYKKLLESTDYIVFNYMSDDRLSSYLNNKNIIKVGYESGYTAYVIKQSINKQALK